MKFSRLKFFAILPVVASCASTEVTERDARVGSDIIPPPETIYVYPFAASQLDIPPWSAATPRYVTSGEPQTAEELAASRELGALVATELVSEIEEMGLTAAIASGATRPEINDLLIIGYFEAVESGSVAKRVLLGFGSGRAELRTRVEGYQMTNTGPRLLGSRAIDSGGNRTPGAIVPLAVLAATANPIGLVVTGSGKLVGEVTGRGTIRNAADRTADAIADELRVKFEEQGWIG